MECTSPSKARMPQGEEQQPKVGDDKHDFLVDNGATHSTMSTDTHLPLSTQLVAVQGVAGCILYLNKNLRLQLGKETSMASSPQCSVNLLGRDFLAKLDATIKVSTQETKLILLDGTHFVCSIQ